MDDGGSLNPPIHNGILTNLLSLNRKRLSRHVLQQSPGIAWVQADKACVVTKKVLAQSWGIGLETAQRTLLVTTQRGVRTFVYPTDQRFGTNKPHLVFPTMRSYCTVDVQSCNARTSGERFSRTDRASTGNCLFTNIIKQTYVSSFKSNGKLFQWWGGNKQRTSTISHSPLSIERSMSRMLASENDTKVPEVAPQSNPKCGQSKSESLSATHGKSSGSNQELEAIADCLQLKGFELSELENEQLKQVNLKRSIYFMEVY
jgi:hypothetical protein